MFEKAKRTDNLIKEISWAIFQAIPVMNNILYYKYCKVRIDLRKSEETRNKMFLH